MGLSFFISFAAAAYGIFFVLLLIFSVHTLILGYHWFSYGTKYETAVTALAVYLLGGAIIFGSLAITLTLI